MPDSATQSSQAVFLTSPWIPAEWVRAHGLTPRAILFALGFGAGAAPLGAGICAFAQGTLHFAELAPGSAVIFSTHCDQLRRSWDSLPANVQTRSFLFNLPVTTRDYVVQRIFRAELERLSKFLVGIGGHVPEPEALARQVQTQEDFRGRLRGIAERCTGRDYALALARFHWDGSGELQLTITPHERKPRNGVRVAIVGGPLRVEDVLWDQLQAVGAEVVLNATEWGERSLGALLRDAREPRPIEPGAIDLLVRAFFERCVDVFQRPNQRLYDWLGRKLIERRVQGIILWHHFGCDLWRAEAQSLREKFGLPVLLLEADESGSAAERSATRLQAFVEAIR
jgi:benzoyl-CoA reductase/2-hydroxyglutaryl-CoA dehydratase subunit BcrC/BadD/HgdB